ncbi:hypothetical protein GZH46_01545 [Fragariocoptes setiger]|uniref:CRAL-TRIO domain-containing protein n=1 Tax=Fragariocoptes setiger TaxID=1670756 RepID=A0ABQ7S961_9ACAR|nr:hypothetical protein GZH46_01545 [Fragariocoptes setiger]
MAPIVTSALDNKSSKEKTIGKTLDEHEGMKQHLVVVANDPFNHELVNELRSMLAEEFEINPDLYDPIDVKRIMDTKCNWHVWRFLKWTDFDLVGAFGSAKWSLQLRLKYNFSSVKASEIPKELFLFGPLFWCGRAADGAYNCYVFGARYWPIKEFRYYIERFLIYHLETFDLTHEPDEKFNLIFENYQSTISNVDLSLVRWIISIREINNTRLNGIYVIGIPWLLSGIISMVISWLPKKLREITHIGTFDGLLRPQLEPEDIPDTYGGLCKKTSYMRAPADAPKMADIKEIRDCPGLIEKFMTKFAAWLSPAERQEILDAQEKYDAELGKQENQDN